MNQVFTDTFFRNIVEKFDAMVKFVEELIWAAAIAKKEIDNSRTCLG